MIEEIDDTTVDPKSVRDRYQYHKDAWDDWRTESQIDREYVDGNPWPEDEQQARKGRRPCYNFNELKQYLNGVINSLRSNPRGIKIGPDEYGTNEETATLEEQAIRQIEYKSSAQVAYTCAGSNQIKGGYGFVKVVRRFIPGTFDQEIRILPVEQVDCVSTDPDAKEPDNSDMFDAFEVASMSKAEFRREYPDAEVRDFDTTHEVDFPNWVQANRIQIANYWRAPKTTKKLILFPNGENLTLGKGMKVLTAPDFNRKREGRVSIGGFEYPIVDARSEDYRVVTQYQTNGVEILKKTPWDGHFIPIIPFWGERVYVKNKLVLLSLPRLARDPVMALNYTGTTIIELTSQMPKVPWLAAEGQFENQEQAVQAANSVPIPFIYYKPVVNTMIGPVQVTAPTRAQLEPAINGQLQSYEIYRQAIRSSMGIGALPTSAQRLNDKSGVALEKIKEASDQGSFHFVDNYERGITNVGRVVEDLLGPTNDTKRQIIVRNPDDTHEIANIDENSFKLRHDVTISTGPSTLSQAEKVKEFAIGVINNDSIVQLALNGNVQAQKFLGTALKLLQLGPMGDPLIEVLDPEAQNDQEIPPAVLEQMNQMKQSLQALNAYAEQIKEECEALKAQALAKQNEIDSRERIAAADRDSKEKIAAMQTEAKIDTDLAKLGQAEAVASANREANFLEGRIQEGHQVAMAGMQHEQQLEAQETAAQQAQEQEAATEAQES